MTSKFVLDMAERAGWTGAEAALGLVVVELADVPVWWAAPVALVAASAKSWVAKHLGRKGTASTLPAAKDPASSILGA
ncbi:MULTISPECIES: hypothetical protein [Streptomyces]|uniref:hypothetical protein n=1 Tax=Streptomyces scabiei TaxID=1930 RepID=UPI0004E79C19|nr:MULTISPECIES: hypothetical protein [Streptomyces]MBP5931816.1 hypothetical protein [Streptomyces sp. LBUM 1479]KFG08214.1 hypothetical protein IQ61_15230 [Streptomyces scabiei]MBP5883185.1 hypothetical protein [Streptomyces sp. LBUM 1487]MDX2626825.1 hypothetical protein [Streptomyces scabiei]MDX3028255.1 hypothetical protein [Streptomyces scabiei]